MGCVLVEMLTGAPPFTADSAAGLAYQHVHEAPEPPSARRPGLPGPVDGLVLQLLAKDPAARPASAEAARAGLLAAISPGPARALAGWAGDSDGAAPTRALPITPPPSPQAPPPGRGWLRWLVPAVAAAAGAAVALLAVALIPGSHPAHPGRPAAAPATPTPAATASHSTPPSHQAPRRKAGHHKARPVPQQEPAVPPLAAATGALVGEVEAGVQAGHLTPQAGQDLFGHLQPLLFNPGNQQPQQVRQQYQQLVQAFGQDIAHGQITGPATIRALRHDLTELSRALTTGPR